jgi:hypothetical protein
MTQAKKEGTLSHLSSETLKGGQHMKKGLITLLAVCFVFAGVAWVSAAQNVANTSQKGSLLIFPKVEVSCDSDTIIEINNDYWKPVDCKCYWVDEYQNYEDFMFVITKNQPVWFSARTGQGTINAPPFIGQKGELKCWAVDAAGANQISFNHLYGEATIFHYNTQQSLGYNSWNFTARGVELTKKVGEGGKIYLTGADGGYDACPEYLVTDFVATSSPFPLGERTVTGVDTDLTVVPCKQDLRQDRVPTYTKLKYDIWNEDEVKYTGAYQCIKCWFEGLLHHSQNGGEKFTYEGLHTSKGRLRIQGVASTVCYSQASPLLGIVFKKFEAGCPVYFESATNTNTAGYDGTGFILWDIQPGTIPEIGR